MSADAHPDAGSAAGRTDGGDLGEPEEPHPRDGRDQRDGGPEVAAQVPSRRGSRRFPMITRDTARPEGGGRAVDGDALPPARQWPVICVLTGVVAGLLATLVDFRAGTLTVGLVLFAGALLRGMLPSVGWLAVRSRFTDVLTYGVLGVVIVLLALMAQPDPWLEIPLLEDLLHFSVR